MKKILLILLLLVGTAIAFFSLNDSQKPKAVGSHAEALKQHRKETDQYFKEDKDSPFEGKNSFKGLNYFEPDSTYIVHADIVWLPEDKQTAFMMTDKSKGEVKKAGIARFSLGKQKLELSFYKEDDHFFIPFNDLTNGEETYGGGRYLNVEANKVRGNEMEIDFNDAYNPYCAYDLEFICPVPPSENHLPVRIPVGEKVYQK